MALAQKKSDNAAKTSHTIENASQFPQIFYCKHMFPGLAGYENEDILIDADAMKRMLPSMQGKPIYVEHQPVDLANLQQEADGYVTKAFYNPNDGWAWAEMLIVSDEGMKAVRSGWSVSNAYTPTEWGAGGTMHNVDYDRKIVNAQFTHLALVPNPRYEDAEIFTPDEFKNYQEEKKNELELRNSKTGATPMFKLFQKKNEEIKNANEITEDTFLTIKNDKGEDIQVSIGEMLNAVKKNDDEEKAKKEKEEKENKAKIKNDEDEDMLNDDTDVNIGDIRMKLGELMNKYNACMKKNADEKEKKDKENAEAAEKKEKENKEDEKKNSKFFTELKNAKEVNGLTPSPVIELSMDKLARGKKQYGSQA